MAWSFAMCTWGRAACSPGRLGSLRKLRNPCRFWKPGRVLNGRGSFASVSGRQSKLRLPHFSWIWRRKTSSRNGEESSRGFARSERQRRARKAPWGTKMTKRAGLPSDRQKRSDQSQVWELRLYVAGQTTKSLTAFANLKQICEEHLAGRYRIEVIDLFKNPQLAAGDQILALPTLVRKLPEPVKKIIGDLSNTERVLVGLDLRPA